MDHGAAEADAGDHHHDAMRGHRQAQPIGQHLVVPRAVRQRVHDRPGEVQEGIRVHDGAEITDPAQRALRPNHGEADHEDRDGCLGDQRQPQLPRGKSALHDLDHVGAEVQHRRDDRHVPDHGGRDRAMLREVACAPRCRDEALDDGSSQFSVVVDGRGRRGQWSISGAIPPTEITPPSPATDLPTDSARCRSHPSHVEPRCRPAAVWSPASNRR